MQGVVEGGVVGVLHYDTIRGGAVGIAVGVEGIVTGVL